jgi:prepilin-type N-terminal cleavage/methylation domain-containing protein
MKSRHGFSLLELLAVVTIIGIIATIVVPRLGTSTYSTKAKMCLQYKGDINAAAEKYRFNEGDSPSKLSELENDPEYFVDPIPVCPVDKKRYSLDSKTGRVAGHNNH